MDIGLDHDRWYRQHAAIPAGGLVRWVLMTVIAGAGLGMGYGWLMWWVWDWVQFLLVPFAVLVVGVIVGLNLENGHIRGPRVHWVLGFMTALVFWYAGWVGYLSAIEATWVYEPWRLYQIVETWYMVPVVREEFDPSHLLMWGVEALFILGGIAWLAGQSLADAVYCETCQHWVASQHRLFPLTPITTDPDTYDEISADAEAGQLGAVLAMNRLHPPDDEDLDEDDLATIAETEDLGDLEDPPWFPDPPYSGLTIWTCRTCQHMHVLSVTANQRPHDHDGDGSDDVDAEADDIVIDRLQLTAREYQRLKDHFALGQPLTPAERQRDAD